MTSTEHFDQAAANWDLTERRVLLAKAVAAAIAQRVALRPTLKVLDFGCGTGLVALELAGRVGSLSGADTSPEMLKALADKARAQGLAVGLLSLEPEGGGDLGGPYDLIVSSMTLHHVADVPALFRRFLDHLRPGGRVALADLDEEDGGFHGDQLGVCHLGFPRPQIKRWLETAGYREVALDTATVTHKEGRDYPVFLATATAPAGES